MLPSGPMKLGAIGVAFMAMAGVAIYWIQHSPLEPSDRISVYTGIVAFAALGTSMYGSYLNRRHYRLTVRPCLRVDYFTYNAKPFQIAITNVGLGPALVERVVVKQGGALVAPDDRPHAAWAAKQAGIAGPFDSYTFSAGDHIKPAEVVAIVSQEFATDFGTDLAKLGDARAKLRSVTIEMHYKSIYGETFVVDSAAR